MHPHVIPQLPQGTALLALCGTLLLALAILWACTVWAYATALLSPPRMTDGKAAARLGRISPADLGYAYDTLDLEPDLSKAEVAGIRLSAWWVPAGGTTGGTPRSHRTALLVHGYADAKVGALAWAPLFRRLGYNLLLPDLRAHGESGGRYTTAGVLEANDLARILRHLLQDRPHETQELLLFGASLGGAAILRLMTRNDADEDLNQRVKAVVLDSPVTSFEAGVLRHGRLLALPGPVVARPALWLARWITGADFPQSAATTNLPRLTVPCLMVLPKNDALLSPTDRQELLNAFEEHRKSSPSSVLVEPDVPHLMMVSVMAEIYFESLVSFLD